MIPRCVLLGSMAASWLAAILVIAGALTLAGLVVSVAFGTVVGAGTRWYYAQGSNWRAERRR